MITDLMLRPASGEFDLPAVERFLERLPYSVRDPVQGRSFMLGSQADQISQAVKKRRGDPKTFPMTVTLVRASAHQIALAFRIEALPSARRFVEWLRDHYDVIILDNEFNDFTSRCKDDLDFIFGPP